MDARAKAEARGFPEAVDSYRWVVLGLTVLIMGATGLVREAVGPLAPFLQRDLQLSRGEIGLIISAMSLGTVITSVPLGQLVDMVGVRRMTLIGPAILGLFVLLLAGASSLQFVLLVGFAAGLAYGSVQPAMSKAIIYWFPLRTRATAMSIKQMGFPLAGVLAGVAIPTLAIVLHWRIALVIIGSVVVLSALVYFRLYRESPFGNAPPPRPKESWRGLKDALTNRDIMAVSFGAAFFTIVHNSLTGYLILYLKEALFIPVVQAGLYLALVQWGGVFGRIGWGVVSDRVFGGSRKLPLVITAIVATGASLAMVPLTPEVPQWLLAGLVLIFGLSAVGWGGLMMTLVAELSGKEMAGTASGVGLTISYIGISLGPPVFGYIVDGTGSYTWSWLFLTACGLVALALFLSIREERRKT